MKMSLRRSGQVLVTLSCLWPVSCSVPRVADFGDRSSLDDGVYLVMDSLDPRQEQDIRSGELRVVKLESFPVKGETPDTYLALGDPIVRFQEMSLRRFQFDERNKCDRVVFGNTEELKAFSREHVCSIVAMVIDGKVVTSHKIRVPLETDEIEISFCTEGSGDHLHEYLTKAFDLPQPEAPRPGGQ